MLVISKKLSPFASELILNRPEKRNALSIDLMKELLNHLKELSEEVRVVILKAEGPIFCSGLDLQEVADKNRSQVSGKIITELFYTLKNLSQITIAKVHGAVMAGGIGLIAASDLVVASNETLFSLPELRRGMSAPLVHALLKKQVSCRHLSELILTAEPISSARASEIGLINYSVPSDKQEAFTIALLHNILKNAPLAMKAYKRSLSDQFAKEFDLPSLLAHHQQMRSSKEAEEGVRSFLEKRPPSWTS